MMKIAIIPARGGSKRIPRKNIRDFHGKPMIHWSIEAARKSNIFDHVVVSTDDLEIADISRNCGADIPFMRPIELADDYTGTGPVVKHAIKEIEKIWGMPDFVCCIYPTAPFLLPTDIQYSFHALNLSDAYFSFSVTSFAYPIQRALRKLENGGVGMFQPEFIATRSQDLEPAYHDAGQFYWGRTQKMLDGYEMFSEHSIPFILPRYRVLDVDTLEDWEHAELLFKAHMAEL